MKIKKNQNYYIYPLTNRKLNTIFVNVNKMVVKLEEIPTTILDVFKRIKKQEIKIIYTL